ncbi:MAG: hypothetical protein BWK79_01345 [Beggiatoa sp. IS2]|nr:MAG: hypothetical protein BWK79_01345 [Beggiatoa sp. IS2]
MRNLLRLEYLFEGITYCLKGATVWDSRAVMTYLMEVLDFSGRIDLKTELTKDLIHHLRGLERWQHTPNVDSERISKLLQRIRSALNKLEETSGQFNESFAQHQLISAVRQRGSIVGGTCRFDLPNYYHWLQKSPKQRQNELSEWLMPLEPLREAIDIDLYMIRNNAVVSQEIASTGFFQSTLEGHVDCQLIQVLLPQESPFYPEISGGKQRFTLRFFEQVNLRERPVPVEQNVSFELCCCLL